MYTRELLLVAGILLLVILGRREHLAFTATNKDIQRNTDTAEQDRIFAAASASAAPAATPAAAAPATPTLSSQDITLTRALQLFRDNLLEYKVTGNTAYKQAADGAKTWLDNYLATLNTQVTRTADSISSQVSAYSTANADLTQTQADFQRVKTEGPATEDRYITNRRQLLQQPTQDDSSVYVKGAIAVGLVIGAVAISFI